MEPLSRKASREFDVVVACGGDGTIREVAMGLLHSEAAMGIVPFGSGNDFSKSIGVASSLETALNIIRKGEISRIDVGKCNDIYFLNTLGIGFDGLTNYYATKSFLQGNLKYAWSALKANAKIEPVITAIATRGQSRRRSLLMITLANGRVEGGCFKVAPNAKLNDGMIDVVTVSPVSKIVLPFLLPLFILGRQHILKKVETFKTDRVQINLDQPTYLHADGEIITTDETEFTAVSIPSALKVIGNFS